MFDKEKVMKINKVYLDKYCELSKAMNIAKKEQGVSDNDLIVNSMLDVYFEPTNRCNLSCVFCARENMQRDYYMLDKTMFEKAIDGLPEGTFISLTGNGEPTLNTQLYDMISYASKKGLFVSIISNGCTLNEENRGKMLESGISRIQFSFQSIDKDTNEKIMRNSQYRQQLINILKFIYESRVRAKNIFISISRVKIEEAKEFEDVSRVFWNKCPIDNYYEGEFLSLQSDSGLYEINKDKFQKIDYKPCSNPWCAVKVNANGDVDGCIQDFSGKFVLGNIKKDSLLNILNSSKAIEFRKASLTGDLDYLDRIGYHCRNCNTWREPVNYDIEGAMNIQMPVKLGLLVNEVAGERPTEVSFIKKVIDYLDNGGTDIIGEFLT